MFKDETLCPQHRVLELWRSQESTTAFDFPGLGQIYDMKCANFMTASEKVCTECRIKSTILDCKEAILPAATILVRSFVSFSGGAVLTKSLVLRFS